MTVDTVFPGNSRRAIPVSAAAPVARREVQISVGVWSRVPRPRVVLDANALMLPFQFRLNLDAELRRVLGACDVYVPASVVRELERVAPRDRAARSALALAAKYRVAAVDGKGDLAVIAAAKALGAHVVTNDRALLAALRAEGVPRISLRSRNHLVLES